MSSGRIMFRVPFKRGDTFLASCTYSVADVPAPLPGAILSQVRDRNDKLIQALTVSIIDASAGQYTLGATAAQTAAWPIAALFCDVQYTDGAGNVSSTATFQLDMLQDVSHE